MKKSQAFLLSAILLLVLFVAGLWFQAHRLLLSEKLHESLIQKVQALTEGTLKYANVQANYFPQPSISFDRVQWVLPEHSLTVEAKKLRFDFNILPLLFGRVEPAAFYVQSGKAEFSIPGLAFLNPVHFENFSLEVGAVQPKIPIPFHFSAEVVGKPKTVVVKGNVVLDSVEEWNWEKASGYMLIEMKQLSLGDAAKGLVPDPKKTVFFKGGEIDTTLEIRKKANEAFLELTATGTGQGLSYEVSQGDAWVAAPAFDAAWNATAAWNNDTTELKFHKALVKLPFGEIGMNGSMKLNTGEISGVHAEGSQMALEDLLKYLPGIEKALPFDIGFSGPGKWVLSMEGTLDHLSFHFAWDLAQVLLSYKQYFTKPKDVPLDLSVDFLLQKGATIGGDFAVKFKEMSMKGNLKDLNMKSGEGQLNLITNKFSLAGWEQYIPVLQGYQLAGDAKLMSNWRGDLRKLEKTEHIFNLSFDKVSWTLPEGPGVRNVSLSLDYSPLMLEGRQMQFEIGGSTAVADLKISGFPEQTKVAAKISSEALKPLETWEAVTALWKHKSEGAGEDVLGRLKEFIQVVFPKGQVLKNVSAELLNEGNVWNVPALQFESYGGKADLKGKWDLSSKEPGYGLDGEFRGVDLGLFLGRQDPAKRVFEGTLDLKGSVTGTGWGPESWSKSLSGQGQWTVRNGKFTTFDLKAALLTIEPLQGLEETRPSLKDFDSMDFNWKLAEGKVATGNLLVKSQDYIIDGEGTLDFTGLANFKMDVFLANEIAAELLTNVASTIKKEPKAHFGPVPMLFSGSLLAPEMKPAPEQAAELTEKIHKGKVKDFLYEVVTE
ncbi:MAG: AsmA-like C-terminal region-containing protein [Candidatus Omnitrophota bacterium]